MSRGALPLGEDDWANITDEATDLLAELIRIDTSNPPGNEVRAAEFLHHKLAQDAIESRIIESAPGRGNLVARIPGRGSLGPLVLLSHTDVAPADPELWQYPPFSGTVADGFVWGRGAIDMKHIVIASFLAAALVKRTSLPLERDLILVASADEESAGESGAGWLWRTHPELVECAIALSEGGDSFMFRGRSYLLIATGQKGWLTVDLTRRSRPRHSSVPAQENCLYEIGGLLQRLASRRFPHRVTWTAQQFVEGLGRVQPAADRAKLLALLEPESFDEALSGLDLDVAMRERLTGIVHSHATPTLIRGGQWTWAIPEQVSLRLAGRALPGETEEMWIAALEEIAGPLGDHEMSDFEPGIETPWSETFSHLTQVLNRHEPAMTVLPALSPGSDLQHPRKAGAQTYGFYPLSPEPGVPSIWELAHGPNERISIANLRRCVRYAWDAVCIANNFDLDENERA